MKRVGKIVGLIIISLILLFIAWVNLTPGHFATTYCKCEVGYFTQEELEEQKNRHQQLGSPCAVCGFSTKDTVLLLASLVDLNR